VFLDNAVFFEVRGPSPDASEALFLVPCRGASPTDCLLTRLTLLSPPPKFSEVSHNEDLINTLRPPPNSSFINPFSKLVVYPPQGDGSPVSLPDYLTSNVVLQCPRFLILCRFPHFLRDRCSSALLFVSAFPFLFGTPALQGAISVPGPLCACALCFYCKPGRSVPPPSEAFVGLIVTKFV